MLNKCKWAKNTNHGLPVIAESELKIANSHKTEFLLQGEILSIKNGLQYNEIEG